MWSSKLTLKTWVSATNTDAPYDRPNRLYNSGSRSFYNPDWAAESYNSLQSVPLPPTGHNPYNSDPVPFWAPVRLRL